MSGMVWYSTDTKQPVVEAGDFLLTYDDRWDAKLIRFGQRGGILGLLGLVNWEGNLRYSWPNHAVLVTGDDGTIIEALGRGLVKGNISKYYGQKYAIVRPGLGPVQRQQALKWANAEYLRHPKYGWTDIVSIIIEILTPLKFDFNWNGSMICSAYVARYLEHGGYSLSTFSPFVTKPGDLATMYRVSKPR